MLLAFVIRARGIPNPVLRLELFRNRDFRWSTIAALFFAVGFNAMFLSNVLFLTTVWHYSILRTGVAIALGVHQRTNRHRRVPPRMDPHHGRRPHGHHRHHAPHTSNDQPIAPETGM